jgi:KDO2-lipid IV(A) lauroyltransferase
MPGRWKRVRHRLELAGVKTLIALPALLPLTISVKLGGNLGRLAFDVFRIRRRVSLDNLERAFGARYTPRERVRIARRSYVNFAKSMVEFASLKRLTKADYEKLVRVEGLDNLERAMAAGRGVVAVTGHYGSWELLGASIVAHGWKSDYLVGEQSNSLVNDAMNELRRAAGIGIIERGIAARGVFGSLKRKRIVALLADQDARRAGIFVDFFGTPASTFRGPGQFAVRAGAPMLCCFIVRQPDESHVIHMLPPLLPRADVDRDAETRRLTEGHVKCLEEFVTRHPDHYFWAHRRWKTKPSPA